MEYNVELKLNHCSLGCCCCCCYSPPPPPPTGQAASLWDAVVSFSSAGDWPCGEHQHCGATSDTLSLFTPFLSPPLVKHSSGARPHCWLFASCCVFSRSHHRATRQDLIIVERERETMINFWGVTPPRHPHLLLPSPHEQVAPNYFCKNTQSNFSCPLMKSSLKKQGLGTNKAFPVRPLFKSISQFFPLFFNRLYQLIIPLKAKDILCHPLCLLFYNTTEKRKKLKEKKSFFFVLHSSPSLDERSVRRAVAQTKVE